MIDGFVRFNNKRRGKKRVFGREDQPGKAISAGFFGDAFLTFTACHLLNVA
jgi:hypothetical protein